MTSGWVRLVCLGLLVTGCGQPVDEPVGEVQLALSLPDGTTVSSVSWQVRSSANAVIISGTLNTAGTHAPGFIASLPAGTGNTVTMTATTSNGAVCTGTSAPFNVFAGGTVAVSVAIICGPAPAGPVAGSIVVTAAVVPGDNCPTLTSWLIAPQETSVADPIDITVTASDPDAGETLTYAWSATAGTFSSPTSPTTTYRCAAVGSPTLTVEVTDTHAPTPCTTRVTFPGVSCL